MSTSPMESAESVAEIMTAPGSRPRSEIAVRPRFCIEAAGKTHLGTRRLNNEDRFALFPSLGLFLLADGMGGVAAGEVAAEMAVVEIREMFDDPDETFPLFATLPQSRELPFFVAAIQRANGRILSAAERDKALRGMGTTIVGVLALGDHIAVAHVGDSRCYRLRSGRLEQLTEDHSLVTELLRHGHWNASDAESFPFAHMLTRALGTAETVEVDTRLVEPKADDVFMLCSDGLSGVVSDVEIAAILGEQENLDGAIDRLIESANDKGGPDNITVALLRWVAT